MEQQMSTLSIVFMAISLVGSFAVPVAIAVYLRKKYRCNIPPFFIGCAAMLLFAFILEQIGHTVILSALPIRAYPPLFALYGGLMAGLFEETGRFVAFRTVMRKYRDNDYNALMYGAGHGGFEAVAILGITMLNNLIFAFMINSGNADAIPTAALNEEQLAAFQANLATLTDAPAYMFLIGLAERIVAIALHMAFSVIVWTAVRQKKTALFVLAIGLHALADCVTVLLSNAGMHPVLIEAVVVLMAAGVIALAKNIRKQGE